MLQHLAPPCLAPVQYEPELFPGLIYRMADPKIVLLIFVSGKVGRALRPSPELIKCTGSALCCSYLCPARWAIGAAECHLWLLMGCLI